MSTTRHPVDQVLEAARDLCQRGRPDVALALYDALAGQPGTVYDCGFGAMWALRRYMGKRGPDPTATLLVQSPRVRGRRVRVHRQIDGAGCSPRARGAGGLPCGC